MPPGAGRRHMAPPPIAKAKAMPQGCGSICPASDAFCIAGFRTGWRLWPPTRVSIPGRGHRASGGGGKEGAASPKRKNPQFPFLPQLYISDTVGFEVAPMADQGGFEPLTSRHRRQIA